jgi:methylated-DNA-[protein]-cysteine S-methyltransferase
MTCTLERVPTTIGTMLVVTDEGEVLRALAWDDHEERMYHQDAPWKGTFAAMCTLSTTCRQGRAGRRSGGETTTYGSLARLLGCESAARAVGAANGANPIGIVVPCHRVVGANGALTGYGSGVERKRWLLEHEGANARLDRAEGATSAPGSRPGQRI